jgi:hypothetical protein
MSAHGYLHEFAARSAAALGSSIETSITLRHHGVAARAASSSDAAARCDQVEAREGEGPCIDAMDELTSKLVPAISTETRWRAWREQSGREGFQAAIAMPAAVVRGSVVALNIYSREPDPWDGRLLTAADSYAQLVATAVRLRLELATVEDSLLGLYRRTADELIVERAVGAIMHLNSCTAQEAHAIFDSGVGRRNVSRREVAETLLQSLAPLDIHRTRSSGPRDDAD